MKEPDYVMKIMATGGSLNEMPDGGTSRTFKQSDGTNTTVRFNYLNHFITTSGIVIKLMTITIVGILHYLLRSLGQHISDQTESLHFFWQSQK
jgi:hypothetical protein